jgi:hypothetical protein
MDRRRLCWARRLAVIACGVTETVSGLVGVTEASAAATYGHIKVSGAVAGSYQIEGECKAFTGITETFVTLDPYALNSPTLSITAPAGASAKRLELAHTGIFDVEYETTAGFIWLAGFSGGTSDLGSGTLTMAAGGRSGSVSAKLLPYRTSAPGPIEVVASWNCAGHAAAPLPKETTVPVTAPSTKAVNSFHLSGFINGNFQMDISDSCSSLTAGSFNIWLLAYNSAGNPNDIELTGYLPNFALPGAGASTFPTGSGAEANMYAGNYAWEVGKTGSGTVSFSGHDTHGEVDLDLAPKAGGGTTIRQHMNGRWAC